VLPSQPETTESDKQQETTESSDQPETTASGRAPCPEDLIAHLARLVLDALDNIIDITALGGSSLNGRHPNSYFAENVFSFANERDLEFWASGIRGAQRRLVKTIELRSSWEIWVNHDIPLSINTFLVEVKELPETQNVLSTPHLRRFAKLERVHLDLSFIMPWQRRDREDVRTEQQIPQTIKDDYCGAMHAAFNDLIEDFVQKDLNNPTIKVTSRIRYLGDWEEPRNLRRSTRSVRGG
jgi:hypothetical protein